MSEDKIQNEDSMRLRLAEVVRLSAEYCVAMENAREMERAEFVRRMLDLLPRIYWNFNDLETDVTLLEDVFFPEYVDEDYYDNISMRISALMGEDDTFLETFEEDMKYSDTPIASSVSECLADIFQPLYNFVERVRESDGSQLVEAYAECRDNFLAYWSQTLCNVLRALNSLR